MIETVLEVNCMVKIVYYLKLGVLAFVVIVRLDGRGL